MKTLVAKVSVVAVLVGLSLLWATKHQTGQENVLTYTTHWVGNTFEGAGPNGYGRWVQDYVDEIEVTPDGAVITASAWDEAGRCTGIYKDGDVNKDLLKQYNGQGGHKAWGWGTASEAVAVEGNFIFIANTVNELLRFRWNPNNIHEYAYIDQTSLGGDEKDNAIAMAARDGVLVLIRKSGEVQVRKTADLSLVRTFRIDNARDVVIARDGALWVIVGNRIERYSPDGMRLQGAITDVGKPSAVALGNDKGQLIVCDDGARQQVLFYDITNPQTPKLVGVFGEKGGLRSGIPGEVKPLKLFALRGAGTDAQGNIYVAMGMTMGETIIRKFTPQGKLVWEVMNLAFVDCFDALEVAPGKFEIYGQAEILGFDPTKPPGRNWWLKAITRDHIRYPDDPRNKDPWGGALIRVLQGRRVLFTTPQMGGGFRVFVFEPAPSQIARYVGEITLPNVELWARNVDSRGNIWLSDGRKIYRYRFKGFDAKGTPIYDLNTPDTWQTPEPFTEIMRLKYIPETDTLYIGGYTQEIQPPSWGLMGGVLARYDNWVKGNRKARYAILMPRDDDNLFPKEFDVAGDYIFAVMVKPTKGIPAMVHVFRADTGEKVGIMFPGPEVGGNSGWIDMVHGIHALKTSAGDYLVIVEEDWRGKNLVYRWRSARH
jgi:sugar lactone lactonase YvrE